MNIKQWIPFAALAATLCLASCNATKARINDNEELYSSYSPEVQAMIKSNRIDHGFDSTQVYLALGNADRTELRDRQEIWYFHETFKRTVKEEKSATEYRAEMYEYEKAIEKGNKYAKEPSTHFSYQLSRTAVERMVVFEEGEVVSWEEPDEMWLEDWHRN